VYKRCKHYKRLTLTVFLISLVVNDDQDQRTDIFVLGVGPSPRHKKAKKLSQEFTAIL